MLLMLYKREESGFKSSIGNLSVDKIKTESSNVYGDELLKYVEIETEGRFGSMFVKNIYKCRTSKKGKFGNNIYYTAII